MLGYLILMFLGFFFFFGMSYIWIDRKVWSKLDKSAEAAVGVGG